MLEQSIIEQILDAWVSIAKARNQPEIAQNVPSANDLKILLEITFLASMKLEEGRPIQVRLVFFPEATPQSLPQQSMGLDTFRFSDPILLTVDNLRKLAPAFDQDSTALAVTRGAKECYTVVGAVFYGQAMSSTEGRGGVGRPRALILSTRSPGNVSISYSDSVLGRFQDGKFFIAKPDAITSHGIATYLLKVLAGH
jgi:hypothetical protein